MRVTVGLNSLTCKRIFERRNKYKKEEGKMKKIALLVIALMMVASVAFAQKITPGSLGDLKGTWMGTLSFDINVNCIAELVIENDTVPVKATLRVLNMPDIVAQQLGITGGSSSYTIDDGKITTQGTLMFVGTMKNFFEVSIKRNKLDGWFYYNGAKGDMQLHKK
jgi:hypothetical protein